MIPSALPNLAVCGVQELPALSRNGFTHVLSLLDPGGPEIETFQTFAAHDRTIMNFHDIIDAQEGKVLPTREHIALILEHVADLQAHEDGGGSLKLLVHCQMGVSRSTAAMLSFLVQGYPDADITSLFAGLRSIRPQAWPNSVMTAHVDELLGLRGRLVEGLREHYARQLRDNPALGDWMIRLGRMREVEMATK